MNTTIRPADARYALSNLPDWTFQEDGGGSISREYRFSNFVKAFEFMRQMADYSEKIQHHPEWSNVYQRVSVRLTTHDAGGLTSRDLQWAIQADQVATSLTGSAD